MLKEYYKAKGPIWFQWWLKTVEQFAEFLNFYTCGLCFYDSLFKVTLLVKDTDDTKSILNGV